MKSSHILIVVLCLLLVSILVPTTGFAQSAGDYRSNGTGGGNWGIAATWQRFNGTTWVPASSPPTGSEFATIQSTDSVYFNVAVSISNQLENHGKLGGVGNLTIANGGIYDHSQNNGSIPQATWATGSTCKVTGYVSGSKPNNSNQSFYNFTWDCAGQTSNVDLAMTGNTIGGNFTVNSTGSPTAARVYLTSPGSYASPITINGNVVVTGGQFASNGSGSVPVDTIVVNTLGNISVTGGNFSVSRGSAPDVKWNLHGDFSVTNATLQNSGGNHVNKLIFTGTGTHNVTLTSVTYGTGTSYFTMEVQSGSTVDLGTSVISSSNTGSFILLAGATLATGHASGVSGCIQCTGASNGGGNSFSTAANYTFDGSVAQVTSSLMPTTVNNLTINDTAGVALSQPTTINGVLRLVAGVFDNTIPFTLGPGGSISYEGGSLLVSVKPTADGTIPESFFVDQNYPNPFNPATTVRFGLPHGSFVTVRVFDLLGQEVATLFEGWQNAGVYDLDFDASSLSSGVYFYRIQADKTVDTKRMVLIK
jgi:hypothetical protein